MKTRKHALLMFSKPPVEGLVKTRLTKERGGMFTPKQAASFFHHTLFDVTQVSLEALAELEALNATGRADGLTTDEHIYDFFVSTCPEENVKIMRDTYEEAGDWGREFHYIQDKGASFDEHFDDAFSQIFELGYESVLSVGGDIPTMPRAHVVQGFQWLHYFADNYGGDGVVLAPCQECGVSLIGFNRGTKMTHQGVYYAESGRPALDAYREKAEELEIPLAYLNTVADVDDTQDLAHTVTLVRELEYSARFQPELFVPTRTLEWVNWMHLSVVTHPNEDRDSREGIDV